MIDPRAAIDPAARLGADVSVGPFSIIGPDVEIGEGCVIGPHAVISGPAKIGRNNRIYQFTSIGEAPQDKKYAGEQTSLEVGDNNVFREFCTIHRGTVQDHGVTRIGDGNLFMAYTHVAHDCVIGNDAIMANAASLAGHVHIGDGAILGGFSIVHQFSSIGAHSFSAMGSVVTRDVLPFITVGGHPAEPHGVNAEGLKRAGYSDDTVTRLRRAYKAIFKSGQRLDVAREQFKDDDIRCDAVDVIDRFIGQSRRSILR